MRVIVNLQDQCSAIVIHLDAVTAYQHYFRTQAGITLDEYLQTLERDGKIEIDGEKTGRKVTITRVGEGQQSQ